MASIGTINSLLQTEKFQETCNRLYGMNSYESQLLRYEVLLEEFIKSFDGEVDALFSSPGRIELCGNHTDHNNGKVLCAAINKDTIAAVQKADRSNIIKIASQGFPVVEVDITDLDYVEKEKGTSKALVKGILRYYKDHNYNIGGFRAATISNVPKGAGMSSSAAFEVLVCEILNELYNDGKIPKMDKARASQFAEYAYFGKPCGLMDQSAVALGGVSYIDFNDINAPEINNIDWGFKDYEIVIVDTGGDHSNLTDNYASIKDEMQEIAMFFGFKTLRPVTEKLFYSKIPALKSKFSGRAIMRAMHFFEENTRVDIAYDSLVYKDVKSFMRMINESGDSSFKKLQNYYVPTDIEQCIPLAVSVSRHFEGVKAIRVHGGGFAGTVLAIVQADRVEDYERYMSILYGKNNAYSVKIRIDGAIKVEL